MAIIKTLNVDQGADYTFSLEVTDDEGNPSDLDGYTGAAQIRKHYAAANGTNFDVTLEANTGIINFTLAANVSAAMKSGRYVYDCAIFGPGGSTTRVLEGSIVINPRVTTATASAPEVPE